MAGAVSDGAVTEGSSSSPSSGPDLSGLLGALASMGNAFGGNDTPDGPATLDGAGKPLSAHATSHLSS